MKTKTLLLSLLASVIYAYSQNPIIQTCYTADPAPMVYNDKVYLYTSHDEDNATWFVMNDWKVYTTTDMVNWTDHGTPLTYEDFSWTLPNSAWAAQCIERNGKFYWYVCCEYPGKWHTVGVAVSDSPTGPFKDALGKPLFITGDMGEIDPSVFIDDDGQAYLYWGNGRLSYVLLNEDMISYDETVGIVQVIPHGVYNDWENGNVEQKYLDAFGPKFEEGPWFYKRNDIYYMLYAAGGVPEDISYSTSLSPTGPWTYRGKIMPVTDANHAFTNHCGVIDFKGNSYFFYHTGALPGGGGFNRATCVEQFTYNADGSIPQINITSAGVNGVAKLNPYTRTEGETIAWSVGLKTETNNETGVYVTQIQNGDYLKVRDVDFGTVGAGMFTASVASASNGGTIELRVGSLDGTIIGTLPISYTGGWDEWQSKSTNINGITGTHDLYLVFKGSDLDEQLFNLDYWQFTEKKNDKQLEAVNATVDKYKIDKIAGINTANYTVTAIYADGSSEDITSQATFTPSPENLISIDNGVITGLNYGLADVTVSYNGKTDNIKVLVKDLETEVTLKSLTINIDNPQNLRILRGGSLPYTVTAEFMDGNTLDVTKVAVYDISNTSVVSFADGNMNGLSDGTATVEISYKGDLGNTFTIDLNITVETFPLSESAGFNLGIWGNSIFDENTLELTTETFGFAGWIYENGIDISAYKYLVVELAEKQTCGASFNIFDENNYWSSASTNAIGDVTKKVINLRNMTKENGEECDPSHIYIMGFWSFGGSPIKIKRIFLSNDGNEPASISSVLIEDENSLVDVYTVMGTRVRSQMAFKDAITGLTQGIYIVGNKKVMITRP